MRFKATLAASICLAAMNAWNAQSRSDSINVEALKSFLSARPAIKTIVFSYASPFNSGFFRTNFYHAAWDGENFFLRQIGSADAYAKRNARTFRFSPSFRGRYGGRFFYVENGLIIESPAVVSPDVPRPSSGSDPIGRALPGLVLLDGCLNLGLWDTYPNSFSWSNNIFTVERGQTTEIFDVRVKHKAQGDVEATPEVRLERRHEPIHGSVEIANEKIRRLMVSEFPLALKYEYSDTPLIPQYLPSTISVYSREELTGVFNIHRLEIASEHLEDSYFAPDNYLEMGSHFRTVFTTRGVKIADRAEQHEWVQAMKKEGTHSKAKSSSWRLLGTLIFLLALLAPPVYFLATRKPKL